MRNANLDEHSYGIRHFRGTHFTNLRYADDTTLTTRNTAGLKTNLNKVKAESELAGLYLNIRKTKIFSNTDLQEFTLDGEDIDVVKDFILLGSQINSNSETHPEIARRLAMGRASMAKLDQIWKDRDISLATKIRLVKALVFSIVAYGAESWTVKTPDKRKIDAFELWCWRRLLRVPWTARSRNSEILEAVGNPMSLYGVLLNQKMRYFGHVIRANGMEKCIMLGMTEGTRSRGRPRRRWIDEIMDETNLQMRELIDRVNNREEWRALSWQIARSRTRLGSTK